MGDIFYFMLDDGCIIIKINKVSDTSGTWQQVADPKRCLSPENGSVAVINDSGLHCLGREIDGGGPADVEVIKLSGAGWGSEINDQGQVEGQFNECEPQQWELVKVIEESA